MRVEKTLTVRAPIEKAWALLADPVQVGRCVPGVERVEVKDATQSVVHVSAKVGIVRARFRLDLRVTEVRPPYYLRSEGAGEETGLASRLRQTTELELRPVAPDRTEISVRADVDVFGRLGTFGFGVLKAKVDQTWNEFAANLQARLE